jgi:phosphate transport system substrate-binding protein
MLKHNKISFLVYVIAALSLCAVALGPIPADEVNLKITANGAGASFPQPIYHRWARDWEIKSGMVVDYKAIGSGGGQDAIKKNQVAFAGSDAPLSMDVLEKHNLVQFPMVLGGVVPVFNLEGIGPNQLRLSGELLGKIFLKRITMWNDPEIVELQAAEDGIRAKLPKVPIKLVCRADSSGTSWVFTHYLQKVSRSWQESNLGISKMPRWQPDLTGEKNEGVAEAVGKTPNSIGYVEFAYARHLGLSFARLQNREGRFVSPSAETFSAAAANANWKEAPANIEMDMADMSGADTWPIVAPTYILMHKQQDDWNLAAALFKFFKYCYTDGASAALELDYVPIPEVGYKIVMERVWTEVKCGDRPCWVE